jgi:DNA repair protein RecO (recombination protein O)
MEQRTYATEGIIIGRKNYGEADRILTLYTKHYGKLRVSARGIRRTTSRKRGSVELFSYVKVFVARGKGLDVLAEVETKEDFNEWRKDLTRVGIAYHLAEVVDRLTVEHQDHEEVFSLLVDAYQNLNMLDYWALYPYTQSFKVRLLEELGFLERGKPIPKNMDTYIEDLINSKLKTKKFLSQLKS